MILDRLKFFGLFSVSGFFFGLLVFFHNQYSWFNYQSDLNFSYIFNLCAKVSAVCFYWLGGTGYILALSLVGYSLFKLVWPAAKFGWERCLGLILLILASNLFCQLYQVGNYGNLPGGGLLGVWLCQKIALPIMLSRLLAGCFLWSGMILVTQIYYVKFANYLIYFAQYLFAPLFKVILVKLNLKHQNSTSENFDTNIDAQTNDTVLMQEYQELLLETDLKVHQDHFWQNYLTPLNLQLDSPINMPSSNHDLINSKPNSVLSAQSAKLDLTPPFLAPLKIVLPDLALFYQKSAHEPKNSREILAEQATVLVNKLKRFGIAGHVSAIKPGPVITLFEFTPAEDAKISKIIALENDLALALQTASLRIIAPIPGKPVVGFEVANLVRESVMLFEVLQDKTFTSFTNSVKKRETNNLQFQIPIAIGKDTAGQNLFIDLVKTPHLLVAGSTGSGKSVALNSILVSMLCANPPERLRLILIDPKRLEFARYAGIGHLLFPIISDAKQTLITLRWVIKEMEQRYEQMAQVGVRNLADYNQYLKKQAATNPEQALNQLPYLVIVVDELADLMMTSGKDVEDLIIRIAQMARAAGIHMIVATQRPSVDVITGLIKVNFPSRISFRVASKADSRTILDCSGADTLLGAGDMLMLDAQSAALKRAHGAYVTDEQVHEVVQFILNHYPTNYLNLAQEQFAAAEQGFEDDEIWADVLAFIKDCDEISISLLQRRFRIGYNRSARIMDMLESYGYVLTLDNGKMRKVMKDKIEQI